MIQIHVYALFDHTACSVQFYREPLDKPFGDHTQWTGLSYVTGPALAHDETDRLVELVTDAIRRAERNASEHGGWSQLD